jgi:uncharacterized protein YecT (DUF1311 family)
MKRALFTAALVGLFAATPISSSAASKAPAPLPGRHWEPRVDYKTDDGRAYRKFDDELNRAYRRLLASSPPATRPMLIEAERNWMRFKDGDCRFQVAVSRPIDQATASMMLSQCLASYTESRLRDIERQLQCPGIEGDVTCPLK